MTLNIIYKFDGTFYRHKKNVSFVRKKLYIDTIKKIENALIIYYVLCKVHKYLRNW